MHCCHHYYHRYQEWQNQGWRWPIPTIVPYIAIFWETWNLAGVIVRTDSIYCLCQGRWRQTGGEDCDVTTEPLHERVPRVPLAPNWNWSLHWINSLRDYRRNFTSPVHRYLRVPSPSSWFPYTIILLSSPWEQSLSSGDFGGQTNKQSLIILTRLLWKSAEIWRLT